MLRPPFYPTPPPKGASRLERLLFLRKNYMYSMALLLPVFAVGLALSVTFIIVVCVACWLVQALGAGTLELRIRAERRASD